MSKRDYSLFGPDAKRAVESGLTAAEWYHTEVPRKVMKDLMARSDQPAIRDTIILYGCMILFAGIGIALWPSWWSAPFWLAYGVLYGSASDSRWHECSHGTAFKTPWMNNWVYEIASFMIMRNSATWRWSHARHHSETYFVGRDPEIAVMRPPEVAKVILNFFGVIDVVQFFPNLIRNAFFGPTAGEKTFVPQSEWGKVQKVAIIHLSIYLVTLIAAISWGSILPLMVIGLPRMYGAWHHIMTGLLQHGGLADNVIDHRLNSRTVYMNPISRFIYWNMNYHVEHHMFPMVPYHALPRLHETIKADLPPPNISIAEAFREMWPAIKRQVLNEEYFLKRDLPPTAKPYREDFHQYVPGMMPPPPQNKDEEMPWIDACATDDIDEEDLIRWDHAGKTFAIYRSPEGDFYATAGLCTHENVHLCDGLVMGHLIECPKHNGQFDYRNGEAMRAPVCVNLKTFPVKVEGDRVFVEVA